MRNIMWGPIAIHFSELRINLSHTLGLLQINLWTGKISWLSNTLTASLDLPSNLRECELDRNIQA